MKTLLILLGRVALSLIFIFAAVHKILNWEGTEQYFLSALTNWVGLVSSIPTLQQSLEWLVPYSSILVLLGTICEGLGGLLVLLGVKVRLGAFLLLLVIIPATIMFHAFWNVLGPESELQMVMFMKNLGIMGGLLLLLAYGDEGKASKE